MTVWISTLVHLGKAFGGAPGGFTTGRKEIIDMLRQRAVVHTSSLTQLAPCIIGASLEVFKMLKESNELHDKLVENVNYSAIRWWLLVLILNQPRVLSVGKCFTMLSCLRYMQLSPWRGHLCNWFLLSCGTKGRGSHPCLNSQLV